MDRKDIEEAVVAALRQSGLNPHRAAVGAGLPEDAIRNVLAGHEPKASRLAQICAALGLEFYIGPPRANAAEGLSFTTLRDLEAGAHALVRVVTGAGGDPIPDDLWPVLIALRARKADDESLPAGVRPISLDDLALSTDAALTVTSALRRLPGPDALDPTQCALVTVEGTSMLPTLYPGQSVVVDRRRKQWCAGEVYAVHLSDAVLVRRARKGEQGEHLLVGDHPRSKPVPFPDTEAVVGTVVSTTHATESHYPIVAEEL